MGPWITGHAWWLAIVILASGWPCMLALGSRAAADREYARGYADAQTKQLTLDRADRTRRGPRHAIGSPRQASAPKPAVERKPWVIVPQPMPASGAYPVIAKFPGSQASGVKGDEDTVTWRHDTGEFAAITAATYAAADATIAAIRDGAL